MKNEVNVLSNLSHPAVHGSAINGPAINHLQRQLIVAILIRQGQKIKV
jgi:hypothetical protein